MTVHDLTQTASKANVGGAPPAPDAIYLATKLVEICELLKKIEKNTEKT